MEDPRFEEILHRLDTLEKELKKLKKRSKSQGHDLRRENQGQPFHEKRVVDLIVRLVTERVDELLWSYLRQPEHDMEPLPEGSDEPEGSERE